MGEDGETRSLRQRKSVNYNLDALELQQFSDDEREGRGGSRRKAEDISDDGSASGQSEAENHESEDEPSESEEEIIEVKKKAEPARVQPSRRGSAKAVNLKEVSESEGLESEEERQKKPRRKSGGQRSSTKKRAAPSTACVWQEAKPKHRSSSNSEETSEDDGEDDDSEAEQQDSDVEVAEPERKPALRRSRRQSGNIKVDKPKKKASIDIEELEDSSEDEAAKAKLEKKKRDNQQRAAYKDVCRVLDQRYTNGVEEVFVAHFYKSYRSAEWLPAAPLRQTVEGQRQIRQYFDRRRNQNPEMVNGILPEWTKVDRVIAYDKPSDMYLVKFQGLPYIEATWETRESLKDDQKYIDAYERSESATHDKEKYKVYKGKDSLPSDIIPEFLNGRTLRDYQVESLKWMVSNMWIQKNCILGDEMGLGKTAQSIAVMEYQRQVLGTRGPFLVVAPLTTLGHWRREIETWTTMNVVQYTGDKDDRADIIQYEFPFRQQRGKQVRFDVLLTSYETLLKDQATFKKFGSDKKQIWPPFQTVIFDEAHRLKSMQSSTRKVIVGLEYRWLLLLTGTPVQNNLKELFGIMNLLDPEEWVSEDDFYERYGGGSEVSTVEQIQQLQADLRPILLRRMKEDVENLPEKEEVIVWVELTGQQRFYYKALYSQQIATLLGGGTYKNLPQMRNLAMELRKACCHPYLCNGLENDIEDRQRNLGGGSELDRMVNASGKMLLLQKLLPKLRSEGRKVLIFSQFKIMLNVIEDFLDLCNYPHERIDGSVDGRERQVAIDRFTAGGDDTFVFMLSTKAGGQGITLTAADTVIIYDSDWNPQNDLQAMARCHRIGQEKEVTIYRLLCKDTYEESLFRCASRKYGLDEAVLGSMNADNPEQHSAKIADLLKNGAHALAATNEAKAVDSEEFANQDISQILAQRTEKRQIGSRAGNTFSTAQFVADETHLNKNSNARDYWTALMPDDVAAYEAKKAEGPTPLGPRKRSRVNYADSPLNRKRRDKQMNNEGQEEPDNDYSATDVSAKSSDDEDVREEGPRRNSGKGSGKEWSKAELKRLEDVLLAFGEGHFKNIAIEAQVLKPEGEVEAVCKILLRLIKHGAEHCERVRKIKSKIDHYLLKVRMNSDPDEVMQSLLPERAEVRVERRLKLKVYKESLAQSEEDLRKEWRNYIALPVEILTDTPSGAREAVQARADYFGSAGGRLQGILKDRAALRWFIQQIADKDSKALKRLDSLHYQRGGRSVLPHWWRRQHDFALLATAYRLGHRQRAAHVMEAAFQDPDSPLYMKVAEVSGTVEDLVMDEENVNGPDMFEYSQWISPDDLDPAPMAIEVAGEKGYKKLLEGLNARCKALVKHLTGLHEIYLAKQQEAGTSQEAAADSGKQKDPAQAAPQSHERVPSIGNPLGQAAAGRQLHSGSAAATSQDASPVEDPDSDSNDSGSDDSESGSDESDGAEDQEEEPQNPSAKAAPTLDRAHESTEPPTEGKSLQAQAKQPNTDWKLSATNKQIAKTSKDAVQSGKNPASLAAQAASKPPATKDTGKRELEKVKSTPLRSKPNTPDPKRLDSKKTPKKASGSRENDPRLANLQSPSETSGVIDLTSPDSTAKHRGTGSFQAKKGALAKKFMKQSMISFSNSNK